MRVLLATGMGVPMLAGAPASAAEFRFRGNEPGSTRLEVRGSIEPGDFQQLQDLVRRNPMQAYLASTLELESPGGDVLDAIRIAEFARDMFWSVTVKGTCASACFYLYAAAPIRSVEAGSVGLHWPHYDRELFAQLLPDQARKRTNELNDMVRGFLARNQVPGWVAELMFSRGYNEVTWLTETQLQALGVRAPYAEELIAAKCGGLDDAASAEDQMRFTACLGHIGGFARLPIVYRLSKGTPQWRAFMAAMKKP